MGATGPSGAPGAPGANANQSFDRVEATSVAAGWQAQSLTAWCDPGDVTLAGTSSFSQGLVLVIDGDPSQEAVAEGNPRAEGWRATMIGTAFVDDGGTATWTVTVFCGDA